MIDNIDIIQMSTIDSESGMPALTTLLYKVCENDEVRFNEACRLVNLFIEKALEKA